MRNSSLSWLGMNTSGVLHCQYCPGARSMLMNAAELFILKLPSCWLSRSQAGVLEGRKLSECGYVSKQRLIHCYQICFGVPLHQIGVVSLELCSSPFFTSVTNKETSLCVEDAESWVRA
jgi:hypothetical protein